MVERNRKMFKLDKRVCRRRDKQLKARYLLCDAKRGWEECTIINVDITSEGMGIKFHTREKIKTGIDIVFEIFISGELEPISVKGIVTWSKQGGKDFIGGIRLTEGVHRLSKLALCQE